MEDFSNWGYNGRGNGLAVKPTSQNPEGPGSSPRLGSIEPAELLNSTPSLMHVLCLASNRHCMCTAASANSARYQLLGMMNKYSS